MEKLLEKIDQSPNPEVEREVAKEVAGMGFAGIVLSLLLSHVSIDRKSVV